MLDLIGASEIEFSDIGGISGLIDANIFRNAKDLVNLLMFLEGHNFPDEKEEGFEDDLNLKGYTYKQLQSVMQTGLVEYYVEDFYVPPEQKTTLEKYFYPDPIPKTIGIFKLTNIGKKVKSQVV